MQTPRQNSPGGVGRGPLSAVELPVLFAAPHRLFFLVGVVQLVAAMLFWLAVLAGWYIPALPSIPLAIFGAPAHGFLMLFGVFTFFVFGFITTVFPRWLASTEVAGARYTTIAALMTLGVLGVYTGFFLGRLVAFAGCAVFVVGWGVGVRTLLGVWRDSARPDKRFALFPLGFISAGAAGAAVYSAWLVTPQPALLNTAMAIGLWLYLVPLVVAISHRMIPFFSGSVLSDYRAVKPGWTLPATLLCVVVHFVLTISDLAEWAVFSDLSLALIAAWHSVQWGLWRSLRIPLLGMLHISFSWLALAMLLYTADGLLRLTGTPAGLGLAPMHALGIGFVASMVVAMATRVSLGHSGRTLVAGRIALWTFALVQITAVVRVFAEIGPLSTGLLRAWLILAAALLWLVAFIPWCLHYGALYVRPRVDRQPG